MLAVSVKFGGKIEVAIVNDFTFVDHHSWDVYNESEDLKTHIEAFKQRFGILLSRIEAGKRVYRANNISGKLVDPETA